MKEGKRVVFINANINTNINANINIDINANIINDENNRKR